MEEGCQGLFEARMDDVRVKIKDRHNSEPPPVQLGMRDGQNGGFHDERAEEEDIEVDDPGPHGEKTLPAHGTFHCLKEGEEFQGT
jgi:hypothetical protein